jgi:AcrR family transcriptional regulator
MDAKPKRRTRERILETALVLFNDLGEPGVTTAAIALTMNISPGNLYYHYRTKDKILEALFADFKKEIEAALMTPELRRPHAEDIWFFLHSLFEAIWKYRFLYRDLNDLLTRHRFLETQFRRILAQKLRTATAIMQGLVDAGEMKATPMEIEALATTMTMVACYWLSFAYARDPRTPADGRTLAQGAFYVISLAAPYLASRERALFDDLAKRYLH